MKVVCSVIASVLLSACMVTNLQAGSITTKRGEVVTGDVQGTLLLKSHVWQLKTESGQYGIVYYILVEGPAVEAISDKGVTLKPYADFRCALVDWTIGGSQKPPSDVEVAKVTRDKNKQMPVEFGIFTGGTMGAFVKGQVQDKQSDVYSLYRDFPAHFTGTSKAFLAAPSFDRLVGEYREIKEGTSDIVSEVRITTETGQRTIKISEIYPAMVPNQ
jgi:hypothetical protein